MIKTVLAIIGAFTCSIFLVTIFFAAIAFAIKIILWLYDKLGLKD